MKTLLVTSTRPFSGKSGIALALIRELQSRGRDVGYFKPYGTMPEHVEGTVTDMDAYYINAQVDPPAPLEHICPVVATRALVEAVMADGADFDMRPRVLESFGKTSAGRDVMIVEGPSDTSQGRALELSVCQVADLLGASVLLVDKPKSDDFPDAVLGACDCLGDRLVAVLFSAVHESLEGFVREHTVPFLATHGIDAVGLIPRDPTLSSVTVAEIVEALGGAVLSAEENLDVAVESFMVGAMGQEKALRFFRRKSRKAVITGGDRADVQLAALETDTKCVILTGNLPPSSQVLSRAEELGVPMVMVDMDTLSAVERMESILGHTRLHDPVKADRIREMLSRAVDLDGLFRASGII